MNKKWNSFLCIFQSINMTLYLCSVEEVLALIITRIWDDLFLNFIYNLIWILLLIIYFLIMTSTWFRKFLQLVIIVGIFLSSFFCSFIIYLPHWLHECFFSPMLSLMWESIGKSCITLWKVSCKSTLPFGRFVRLGIRVDTTNFLLFQ